MFVNKSNLLLAEVYEIACGFGFIGDNNPLYMREFFEQFGLLLSSEERKSDYKTRKYKLFKRG